MQSLNYLNIQSYLDAVDAILAWENMPEDALSNLLAGNNSAEYGGYCID